MAVQLMLNMLLAVIWMTLQNDWTLSGLLAGYALGLLVVWAVRRFFSAPFYARRLWAVGSLLLLFVKELVLSSLAVARHIVAPRLRMKPGIFSYTTELKAEWEVALLACLICLTPGTLTLDVSDDNRTLYIHAIDIEDAGQLAEQIRATFEAAIVEVSRR